MRRANFTVFDEFVPQGPHNDATAVFTSQELNAKLGHFDQLAIQVVVDNVSGTTIGTLSLFVEHSADGRNWIQISASAPDVLTPATGVLSTTLANTNWNVAPSNLLGFVRFKLYYSNQTTNAHIRVHVTQRDQG